MGEHACRADRPEVADAAVMNLTFTVEARTWDAMGHGGRVAEYATALGATVGLRPADLDALRHGAFLHDIGKVGIPEAVLLKPDRLTAQERQLIERHPAIGDEVCRMLDVPHSERLIVRCHHERLVPLIFDFFKKSLVIWGHRGLERCAVRTASPSREFRRLSLST